MTRTSQNLLAVLLLRDGFSRAPISDVSITFALDGAACEPLRKADGFFVFRNLACDAPNRLRIACRIFLDSEVVLTPFSVPVVQPPNQRVVVHELEPGPFYRYPRDTTIVCGKVLAEEGPLDDVDVFAAFMDRLGTWQWRKTKSYRPAREPDVSRGFYALSLPLTAMSADVNLRFTKDGHMPYFDRVTAPRSMTTIVNASLQRANA